jgi:hypothetical protein
VKRNNIEDADASTGPNDGTGDPWEGIEGGEVRLKGIGGDKFIHPSSMV